MNYVMHFDVAALVITITIMLHFFLKKSINTRQTALFSLLILLALISNLCDLLSVILFPFITQMPIAISYAINQIYFLTFNGTSMVYFLYIVLATKETQELTVLDKVRIFAPICVDIVLILSTPWSHAIFYFNEKYEYCHGGFMVVLYAMAMLYVGMALFHTYCYRRKLNREQRVSVYFYTIASFAAVIFQMAIFSNIMIIQFAVSISVMLIYLSLENPEDYTDKQFGILNRIGFQKILHSNIEKKRKFELLQIQVEGMEYINETIGVLNGEILLRQIAEFLEGIATGMRLFYMSGSKFVILTEQNTNGWETTIRQIKRRFKQSFRCDGIELSLSAALCCLSYPENVQSAEDIMDVIDFASKDIQKSEATDVIIASEEMLQKKRRENKILQIMNQAIRQNAFSVYYQPIYSVKKQRFTSAEALVRLDSQEIGFVSPEEFIPLAEQNGLILKIGEYVFRSVCEFMSSQRIWECGIEYIEINLSVVQCMQEKLHEKLLSVMDEYHLEYRRVNLEITETAAIVSSDTLQRNMTVLQKKGVTFAMDDYGTGYSNTGTVITYPFDIIKLDKSMLWSAMENNKAFCALKHTIMMIKEMKMHIVAEGVETQEQADILTSMGCDYFQGYFFSKPVPEKQFLEKLNQETKQKREISG